MNTDVMMLLTLDVMTILLVYIAIKLREIAQQLDRWKVIP